MSKYNQYFERDTEDENYLICKLCIIQQDSKPGRYIHKGKSYCTNRLRDHLLSRHNINLNEVEVSPVDIAVSNVLLHHDCAIHIVDCNCFKMMIKLLRENNANVSCSETFRKTIIPSRYSQSVNQTISLLDKEEFICVELDHWTSLGRHSYLVLIAQWITQTFDFNYRLLGTFQVGDHLMITNSFTLNIFILNVLHQVVLLIHFN